MPDTIFLAEADQAEAGRLRAALKAAGVVAELRATPSRSAAGRRPGWGRAWPC